MLRVGIAEGIDGCLKSFLEGLEDDIKGHKKLGRFENSIFCFIYKMVYFLFEQLLQIGNHSLNRNSMGLDTNGILLIVSKL